MDWNISDDELLDIIDLYLTKLIYLFGGNIVPLQFIYLNLNKELKVDGIILRKNNKCRSINTYIKFKYKKLV